MREGQQTLSAFEGPRAARGRGPPLLRPAVRRASRKTSSRPARRSTTQPGWRRASWASAAVRRSTRPFADIDVILTPPARGRGAARAGADRRCDLQPAMDLSLDALRDLALYARDRPACRSASSSSAASTRTPRCSTWRLGEGSAAMKPLSATEAVARHRSRHAHLREAGAGLPRPHRRARRHGEGLGPSRSRPGPRAGARPPMRPRAACCAACRSA